MTIEEQLLERITALEEECAAIRNAILGKADNGKWVGPSGISEKQEGA